MHFFPVLGLMLDSHIGWAKSMPFASINPTNPRTHPAQFGKTMLRIDHLAKWFFFESAILDFFFQKKKKFWEKKIQIGRLKKTSFCQTVNSQYFFAKLSGMRPWVSRIDRCKGHWFVSIYMAVRLSDINSKMTKKQKKCFLSSPIACGACERTELLKTEIDGRFFWWLCLSFFRTL